MSAALWLLLACGGGAPEPVSHPVGDVSDMDPTLIRADATYPAAVQHYLEWSRPGDSLPDWLVAYRQVAGRFRPRSPSDGARPGEHPSRARFRCGYLAESVDSLRECLIGMAHPEHHETIRIAVARADRTVGPSWSRWRGRLQPAAWMIEQRVNSGLGFESLDVLLRTADVTREDLAAARFVVVPNNDVVVGRQLGEMLLVAGHRSHSTFTQQTAFHELAHYAAEVSPHRQAFEESLLGCGPDGIIAANHWNEAVATAFGMHVATMLDLRRGPGSHGYDDDTVTALATGLHQRWSAGEIPSMQEGLAEALCEITAARWPADKRRLKDYLWGATFIHEAQAGMPIIRTRHLSRFRRSTSRLSAKHFFPGDPATMGILVMTTAETFGRLAHLRKQLGVPGGTHPAHLTSRVHAWRGQDEHGRFRMWIVAPDLVVLRAVARRLSRSAFHDPPPALGWSRIPRHSD